ncbi:MAG TPA: hypothetical protein VIY26_16010 [Acidimicrobiales bacterium]
MEHTEPSQETDEEERTDAEAPHMADRAATPEEERLADESRDRFAGDAEDVAEKEREMGERGANQKGEGRIP